jgi:TfoX/Sxy family transcriptional regulator of competence genes
MAYNLDLAQRVRKGIGNLPGYTEREMFGGIGFMLEGNMCCGVIGEDLIVRVGPGDYEGALSKPHVRPFDMSGRPMRGWVVVTLQGVSTEEQLMDWVQKGVEFAQSLPAK